MKVVQRMKTAPLIAPSNKDLRKAAEALVDASIQINSIINDEEPDQSSREELIAQVAEEPLMTPFLFQSTSYRH